MNKDSKIYVAGHNGMVGSAILRKLKEEKFQNIITRNSKELDLRNQLATEEFFQNEKPEYVFLAAAKVGGIVANNNYKADFIYDNTAIALNVIHSAFRNKTKRLINLGSSCIYPKHAKQPMTEDQFLTGPLEPTNEAYAIAKITAIKLCRYFNKQYGTEYISLMPTNMYGTGDNYNLEKSHVLPALLRKMLLGKALMEENFEFIWSDFSKNMIGWGLDGNIDYEDKSVAIDIMNKAGINKSSIYIWGSGNPKREFMHSDDLAEACIHFINLKNIKQAGEFLNIGSGIELSIKDLAYMIKEIVGYQGNLDFDSTKPDGTPRKLMDSSLANSLGWKSKIGLKEGIKLVLKDYIN